MKYLSIYNIYLNKANWNVFNIVYKVVVIVIDKALNDILYFMV